MSKEVDELFHQILCACIKSVASGKKKIRINKQQPNTKKREWWDDIWREKEITKKI